MTCSRLLIPARTTVALCSLASSIAACAAIDEPQAADCSELSCVVDGQPYSYRPTREAALRMSPPQPPAIVLPESAYEPLESAPTHSVTFSADLEQVELVSLLDGTRLTGMQQEPVADRIAFELDAFAGGQFHVWFRDGELQAELTLFGSGVPIVSSTRGLLEPRSNAR